MNLISLSLRGIKNSLAKGCSHDILARSQNGSPSSQLALRVPTILARKVGTYLAAKSCMGSFKKIQMSYSKGIARETHLPSGRNMRRPHCLHHPS